ncbi:hypothetical protein N0V90_012878 [Kalmusia sp. IMI 367209]|nr:hypothetical protein N0V90_012878 [Kalmusia sp. IMI 367209]
MAAADELARELAAVVNSPYPASLDKLAHACSHADVFTVRAWVRRQPFCAIVKLAADLSDALPHWQCCVAIIECLAHSPEFRNELLIQNPSLLDALLTKANTSQHDFRQHLELCVVLLSQPLPEGVSLPASIQPFLLQLFELASRNPGVQTLKPIYLTLNGACRGFRAQLSPDANQLFDAHICHILTSQSAGESSMLLLWCFGVVILAEHPELVDRVDNASSDALKEVASSISAVQWTTDAGRKMFGTKKSCHKTITLACLSVVWAIKDGVGVPDDEALRGIPTPMLEIATRTLRFVDQQVLEQWLSSDTTGVTRSVLPKLLEKVHRRDLKPFIQLEALNFYALIAGPNSLGSTTIPNPVWPSPTFLNVTNGEQDKLQELPMRSIVRAILEASVSPKSTDQMQNTTILVNEIARTVVHHEYFRGHIIAALSQPEVQGTIQSFLATRVDHLEDDGASFCQTHDITIRQTLMSATASMLLTTTLAGDQRAGLPLSLAVALVEKQRQLPVPSTQCTHARSRTTSAPVSLFQQEGTPGFGLHSHDWRNRLKAELKSQASYQREAIIRSVAQICRDLESRCDTVEEPLRRERDKSNELEKELVQIRASVESLEQKRLITDNLILTTLEAEKNRLERENDELSTLLVQLRADMEKTSLKEKARRDEADEANCRREMQFNSTRLELELTIRAREEEWRYLVGQHRTLQAKFEHSEREVKNQKEAIVQLETLSDSLEDRLREAEHKLNEERQSGCQKAEELLRLGKEATLLEENLHHAKAEKETATEGLKDLQDRYHTLEAAASQAASECNLIKADLHCAYAENAQLSTANQRTRQDLEAVQASIPPLQVKIQELTDDCIAKDIELKGLKTWKDRVVTSMGLPLEPVPISECPRTPDQGEDQASPTEPQTQPPSEASQAVAHSHD